MKLFPIMYLIQNYYQYSSIKIIAGRFCKLIQGYFVKNYLPAKMVSCVEAIFSLNGLSALPDDQSGESQWMGEQNIGDELRKYELGK